MKKIFSLLLFALCAISYTACTNEEGIEYVQESSIKIVSRDVSFPAAASQGISEVEAPGEISVKTSGQGWCTTTVSGSTIQVNVEQNPGLEGRTSMLTIRCGADSTRIAVHQSGVIFELSAGSQIMADDKAATYSFDLTCNTELTLNSSEEWISVAVEDGKMNITLKENNTGHIRKGNITYTAGTYQDAIQVTQCEFDKDLAGDYRLYFTDSEDGKLKYLSTTLSKSGNTYSILLNGLNLTIPVAYNQKTRELTVNGGKYMGDYGSYKVHTVIWDTNEGYLTWDTSVSMAGTFEYGEEEDGKYTILSFKDNGSWGNYHPDAICLEAFTATPPSKETHLGSLMGMVEPFLYRTHDDEIPAVASALKINTAKRCTGFSIR